VLVAISTVVAPAPTRALLRAGLHQAGGVQVPTDRRGRHDEVVVMLQVPGDGVWPVVESFAAQFAAEVGDQVDRGLR